MAASSCFSVETISLNLERFGFFLELYQADKEILDAIYEHLILSTFFPILLNFDSKQKAGKVLA